MVEQPEYAHEYAQSLGDPAGFWGRQAGLIEWDVLPQTTLDAGRPHFPRWFPDGRMNTCFNAVDRHVRDGRADQLAVVHDSPVTSTTSALTYAELQDEVARFAGVLASLGVTAGDRVLLYLPMVPEAIVAMLACARAGRPDRRRPAAGRRGRIVRTGTDARRPVRRDRPRGPAARHVRARARRGPAA